ncbi:hypothetical protein HNY73_023243 [Argiope bruennichi]|uniref:Uncharacterized protein n=1 Tax=Argiope bruennichi TaxID=94029 RepID=A0A8T0E3H8_ARGBR|nr:hypothetical protein HNY73_023243 [Argiope bruennichi]
MQFGQFLDGQGRSERMAIRFPCLTSCQCTLSVRSIPVRVLCSCAISIPASSSASAFSKRPSQRASRVPDDLVAQSSFTHHHTFHLRKSRRQDQSQAGLPRSQECLLIRTRIPLLLQPSSAFSSAFTSAKSLSALGNVGYQLAST